ncbi:alpha/beta hydrolase [Ferrovibrio sp.]|uniref:alpha/beta hydrolase n=1 Tax=Ferrovibrio sp. TaxID=1917215 RepID=UPI0035AE45FE
MDRAALDKQYNLRQAVPGHLDDFARWRRMSDAARAALPHRADLAYGGHPLETLDFFSVPQPGRPLIVFIHGGYWQAMDKADFSFAAMGFASEAAGHLANVAVINYPLAPAVRMDRIAAANRRALLWLWRNAAELGADPGRIYAMGHSAGGHLVADAALADWRALAPAAPQNLLRGGLAISGLFDLRPIQQCYLNDGLRMDQPEAERNSPLLRLPFAPRPLVPMALAVGERETDAFHEQQSVFAQAYHAAGGEVMAITEPHRHHFDILDGLGRAEGSPPDGLRGAMLRLIEQSGDE